MSSRSQARPIRVPGQEGLGRAHPRYVVWELTLACNLKCRHCGSRAGLPRENELTTDEALDLVGDLAAAGTREVTLIGGEAYLRRDWLAIVAAIARADMLCTLQTGGRALTRDKLAAAKAAGLAGVGVSVDGLPATHDLLRGVPGSQAQALGALAAARDLGLAATANTQINRRNLAEIESIFDALVEAGASAWMVQLTVPMGNAADDPDLLLQPHELAGLIPRLYGLFERGMARGLRLIPGNNIGYFGPYEAAWRSLTGEAEHYGGCMAGRAGLGIEADGSLKACPSLPSTPYVGGQARHGGLAAAWETSAALSFMRDDEAARSRLWGFCRACRYGAVCRGGCTWTAHVLTGRPGNNPYCHYRVTRLAERGLHEVVEHRAAPSGQKPFDHGLFDIVVVDREGGRAGQDIYDGPDFAETPVDPTRPLVVCARCDEFGSPDEPCMRCGQPAGEASGPIAARIRNALLDNARRGAALTRHLSAITAPASVRADRR